MPFRTLYAKLAFGLIALLIAVGVVYAFASATALRRYQETVNQELNRDLARNLVFDRNLVDRGRIDQQAVKETFALYMTINPSIEIYLLDPKGAIVSYSADPAKIKRNAVSLGPIRTFLADDAAYPVLGDDPRSHDRRKVFSVTPVPSADDVQGYLYVVLRGEEYDSVQQMASDSHFFRMSAWSVATALAFGLIAGLIAFRLLTRRLERLSRRVAAFDVDHGAAPAPPTDDAGDEIERLDATFARMAERIDRQIEQLRDQDALRRRLVAQVSHDLRTPLASLQGYLESLQIKGATLDDGERERFLAIALDQGRRLSRLIDELFELAALDAREKKPHPETFSPAELAHDVAAKHEPAARAKGVTVTVDAGPDAPLAHADLGMTERVLDNVIDNAIVHAPEGGHIEIRAGAGDDDAPVMSVADDGPGIGADDLPHLFEPFYRADGDGGSGHAGLGLAIAKRMMILQGGDIAADSRPGGGATFTLALPRHGGD